MRPGQYVTHPDHPGVVYHLLMIYSHGNAGRPWVKASPSQDAYALRPIHPVPEPTTLYLKVRDPAPVPLHPCPHCGPEHVTRNLAGGIAGVSRPHGYPCDDECPVGIGARALVTL